MKKLFLAIIVLTVWVVTATAGTVETFQFESSALEEDRYVQVYLPDGYDPGYPNGFPAIYFLHGANGSHATYPELITALNSEITAGRIQPVVVIKPDGGGCNWGFFEGCNWSNSELQGDHEDYVVFDVIAEAESRYNIIPSPSKRAIMGHSMGGFGAMQAALDHPDKFCAVASHSTYLYFDDLLVIHQPIVLSEQSGSPPWVYTPTSGAITSGWFMFAGSWSPNADSLPYLVDFPLDGWGDLVPETWDRWKENDPAVLAEALVPGAAPAIYFDCGTNDGFSLHPFNVSFDAHLTALGIDHEWQSYFGDHGSLLHQRFPISLNFIDDVFNDTSAVEDRVPDRPGKLQVSPNPFNPATMISFVLPEAATTTLRVFDVSGHLVRTLLNGAVRSEGSHEVPWNGRNDAGRVVAAGVYFCKLQAGDFSDIQRMTLLK